MTDFVTPRIDATLRQQFQDHSAIRIIGKCVKINGNDAVLDCNGEVEIKSSPDAAFEVGRYFEVVGKVQDDMSIQMLSATDFGTNIGKFFSTNKTNC